MACDCLVVCTSRFKAAFYCRCIYYAFYEGMEATDTCRMKSMLCVQRVIKCWPFACFPALDKFAWVIINFAFCKVYTVLDSYTIEC